MSIYAEFDNGEQRQIASNQGWSDLVAWSESLDESQFPEIVHLCDNGYEQQLESLERQLGDALAAHRPADDIAATIEGVLDALAMRGGGEVLFITNGMSASEEGEGDEQSNPPPPANA